MKNKKILIGIIIITSVIIGIITFFIINKTESLTKYYKIILQR